MNFSEDYLNVASRLIESIFRDKRSDLLAAHGNVDTEFKDDQSVVTAFDQEMESNLKKTLRKLDAGIGFQGEEFGKEGNTDTFWLVDPIDGTESFVRGISTFRNMATFIDKGKPVYTIIYRPVSDDLFVASTGKGATKNGKKIEISQRQLHRLRVEFATNHAHDEVWPVIKAIAKKVERVRFTDEFLYVAEAKLDVHIVYKSDTKTWDTAPRMLLLKECGAEVANIGSPGWDYQKNNFVAASPAVFDELFEVINSATQGND
jgi:fructose-1,6-bisphosphatase/inositol monophosphatase family enzyme